MSQCSRPVVKQLHRSVCVSQCGRPVVGQQHKAVHVSQFGRIVVREQHRTVSLVGLLSENSIGRSVCYCVVAFLAFTLQVYLL